MRLCLLCIGTAIKAEEQGGPLQPSQANPIYKQIVSKGSFVSLLWDFKNILP